MFLFTSGLYIACILYFKNFKKVLTEAAFCFVQAMLSEDFPFHQFNNPPKIKNIIHFGKQIVNFR